MKKHIAYLSMGANIGEKKQNLISALDMLDDKINCNIESVSSLYSTIPVGFTDQPDFYNIAIKISTDLNPQELLDLCNKIEKKLGRKRTIRWGPRVIDIDILIFDNLTLSCSDLIIPHPRMMQRAFVIVPLKEISEDINMPADLDISGVYLIDDKNWRCH